MSNVKKSLIVLFSLIICIIIALTLACSKQETQQNQFTKWNEDAQSLKELKSYVEDVTNPKSENFIPEISRVAVFDFNGTIFCEKFPMYFEWLMIAHRVLDDPDYKDRATPKEIEIANQIRSVTQYTKIPEELDKNEPTYGGGPFAGMPINDYYNYVKDFSKTKAEGFKNMLRGDAYYEPMKDVIHYLESNDFDIYIVTASDSLLIKMMIAQSFPEIPSSHVIGLNYTLLDENNKDINGIDFKYSKDTKVIRGPELKAKKPKMDKVVSIIEIISQYPCLAFGNSSGDEAMLNFTMNNKDYKSKAFLIKSDDEEREYGTPEGAKKMQDLADKNGWTTISMRDDWKTIYGENVEKDHH